MLEGIAIDENLGDVVGHDNLPFNLIRSNVLALREFENVFLSIDNLKNSMG